MIIIGILAFIIFAGIAKAVRQTKIENAILDMAKRK